MLSFKALLISTTVLSAAVMLKFSFPVITDFAVSEVPSIYDGVVSWLRPPYLYLIINCIIITIVASSKLQSKKDDVSALSPPLQPLSYVRSQPLTPVPVKSIEIDYPVAAEYQYNGVVLNDSIGSDVNVEKGLEFDAYEHVDATKNVKIDTASLVANAAASGVAFAEDAMSNKENEYVIGKSTWSLQENKDSAEYSPSNVKPPASARFGPRRNVRASPEGGRTVLGVSKPKKQDTLESTWKTITEGRSMPLTRHLRKSDTWERDNHLHGAARHRHQQEEKTPQKTMTKAETFNDRTNTRSPSPGSSSGGSGKLKREASPSQDELNRRVEAFIKKFNEDMRLQRQESFNQYMEMINRGAH
ncbi:hypothetical protein BUALT_Bualt03G0131400 [Buddleja alternifolia]|uniref:DUF4408 domain-containing protein n=1 Tax=Buddleja alternifolia TaxID=168488 RepID=A0AAV6XUZ1_9LAMI|nr:hypothetical protein BUALT_Bualt03G0131400 [Buddleja alternifolia]